LVLTLSLHNKQVIPRVCPSLEVFYLESHHSPRREKYRKT
jgi:hypothetical protein